MLVEPIETVFAAAPVPMVIVLIPAPSPICRVFPPVPVLIFVVLAPFPIPTLTILVAEELPNDIVPVWAVAPRVIVAATLPAIMVLPPEPDCNVNDALAVVEPIVITLAAAPVAILKVLTPVEFAKLMV